MAKGGEVDKFTYMMLELWFGRIRSTSVLDEMVWWNWQRIECSGTWAFPIKGIAIRKKICRTGFMCR
jgi:hypothetical protein